MTAVYRANPGVFCDGCGEPCRPHFVKQCPDCGAYICRTCLADHECEPVPVAVVRRTLPQYVTELGGQFPSNS